MILREPSLCIGLGEYDTGWHDPDSSLDRAARVVEACAASGARLVVLPEMCTSGFTMSADEFAEPLEGPRIARLGQIARSQRVWLLAGVAVRAAGENDRARNAALLFEPSGALGARYDKQRLFTYAKEHESYEPGSESVVVDIEGVRVAPFICYDLRFPELFRRAAPATDVMVLIASWPAPRRAHWDALLPARAIENQCYFIGVNRTGHGGDIEYDGGSAAYDPWGLRLAGYRDPGDGPRATVDVRPAEVLRIRSAYPFLADAAGS